MLWSFVRLSVCHKSVKMTKPVVMQQTPYDSPVTLVFWGQRSGGYLNGFNRNRSANYRADRLKSTISETVQDRDIVKVDG